jgi:hypothetical protein
MGEPLTDQKQHHWHHDRSSSHHTGAQRGHSSSGDKEGAVHRQQDARLGDVRQPSGVYAATLAADRLLLKAGPPGSSGISGGAQLLLPSAATAHQQQLDRSHGSASSSRSSSSWHADGTHKSWKEGAPALRWAASRPVEVPGGGCGASRHPKRLPASAKGGPGSAQVAAAGRSAGEESEGSSAGSDDGSFMTAAGGSLRSFTTALSTSSSDGISAVGSPGTPHAAVGPAAGQSTSSRVVAPAEVGVADKHQGSTCSSSHSLTPAGVPVVLSLTTPAAATEASVNRPAAPAAAAAPAGEEGTAGGALPVGAAPEEGRQLQEQQQHSQHEQDARAHSDSASTAGNSSSSAQDDGGTLTYEIEVLGIIPGEPVRHLAAAVLLLGVNQAVCWQPTLIPLSVTHTQSVQAQYSCYACPTGCYQSRGCW